MQAPGAVNVVVGPLPMRWAPIGFGLLWLVVVGFAASMRLETMALVCRREAGQAATCDVSWSGPLARAERFPPGAVAAVEVYEHAGLKGNSPPSYVVTLLDGRGRETGVESYAIQHDAEAERDALRAFFADRTRLTLTREIRPRPATYAMLGAVLLVGSLIILHGVSSGGRLWIALDEARRTARIHRTILGVPIRRSVQHAAAEIVDARLENREVSAHSRQRWEPEARLILLDARGRKLPATAGYLRAPGQMQAGLRRVREALGAQSPPSPKSPLALEAPPAVSVLAKHDTPPAGNVASALAPGPSTLRLFLWVALVAALGFGGMYWFANETQGWLEVEAESRCELGGATLLPGASMSTALDPGSYTIRVFNPNVPGDWETQKFEIKLHETTRVQCRPTRQ